MDKNVVNELNASYVYEPNHEIRYISGAYGGFNGNGDFIVNFYFERTELPRDFKIKVGENNSGVDIYQKLKVIREVKAGVSMNINVAKQILKWLDDNIKVYEQQHDSNQ